MAINYTPTDHELIAAAHPGTTAPGRDYRAVYLTGDVVTFRAANRHEALRFAHEYGIRFLNCARVADVRWSR